MTLTFRAAGSADVSTVVDLVESAYRGERSRRGWTTEADLLDGQRTDAEAVTAIVSDPKRQRIVLAERDGELVASAHLERCPDWACFGMFAVRPEAQGCGIGGQLLRQCEGWVKEGWGCTRMRMTVIGARHELIAYYQRRGYRCTGERQPFPYGQERFGIPKRDDLYFEILSKDLCEP